jgi:DNA repair protein RadC
MPIIREIMHSALQKFAVSIICAHNHPGGNTAPSSQDYRFTDMLTNAANLLEINVLDHVIIGNDTCYSLTERGKIKI